MQKKTGLMTRLLRLFVWGIAFAYIEAAVVVYLRQLYYPEGFAFPVILADTRFAVIEIAREFATLVLIGTTAYLAVEKPMNRLAAFMVLFGVWDLFYYLFLKVLLNWPQSLRTWDLLFLIPLPWAAPVWAPVVVSLGLVYAGAVVLVRDAGGTPLRFGRRFLLLELAAGSVIIFSFLIPGQAVLHQSIPAGFPWQLFFAGFLGGFAPFLYRAHFKHSRK
jgi:hypothetical protein